ncbi:MAG: DNA translocase FtsK 4TM domain-containing protein, partial [Firmicutes bacterium]|nr:DNA translocase FtsK 4TM domain-containing protein [Bacillota bacterium]
MLFLERRGKNMKLFGQLKEDLRYEIFGLILLALSTLGFLGLLNGTAGVLGNFTVRLIRILLGEIAPLIPLGLGWLGLALVFYRRRFTFGPRYVGALLLIVAAAAYLHQTTPPGLEFENAWRGFGGGLLGAVTAWALRAGFGSPGHYVVMGFLALVGILLLTGFSLKHVSSQGLVLGRGLGRSLLRKVRELSQMRRKRAVPAKEERLPSRPGTTEGDPGGEQGRGLRSFTKDKPVPGGTQVIRPEIGKPQSPREEKRDSAGVPEKPPFQQLSLGDSFLFQLPPLSLLDRGGKVKAPRGDREITDKARLLEATMETFGVNAKVVEVSRGPTVTRFEVQPAPGIKVSKVVSLADDIALSLAAQGVRIEAPIPGKSVIGIEVPNQEISTVRLREVLETPEFQNASSPLTVALGKD